MRSTPPGAGRSPVARAGRARHGRGQVVAYLLTVWFILTLNFLLPRAMPGDPVEAMLASNTSGRGAGAEERAAAARYYGLDQPLWEQYRRYLGDLSRLDLGMSIHFNQTVSSLLSERLPWTLLLGTTSVAVGTAIGVGAGVSSGWRRGRRADRVLVALFTAARGFPPFFVASVAAFVFAVKLRWFPLAGAQTPFAEHSGLLAGAADVARHLALPAGVATVLFTASSFLLTRAGMVGEMGADYLLLGRAKGLRERRLEYGHAARNVLSPLVALTALELGSSFSALVFVETVFAYPGLGRLVFEAVASRDYPVLQGCFLVITLAVVTLNRMADLVSLRLDPRVAA